MAAEGFAHRNAIRQKIREFQSRLGDVEDDRVGKAVQQLKREPGKGPFVGGVKLPRALAELGLIDEYEFVMHPRLAGHGPTLFMGLSKHVDLRLVSRLEFGSGGGGDVV
jgi:dihydrofolate reductase